MLLASPVQRMKLDAFFMVLCHLLIGTGGKESLSKRRAAARLIYLKS